MSCFDIPIGKFDIFNISRYSRWCLPGVGLLHLPPSLESGQGKTTTFYFTESFCCTRLNKSVLETTERKQADSQLHFAPTIIKIHLLVFENELIEDAVLVLKKSQN